MPATTVAGLCLKSVPSRVSAMSIILICVHLCCLWKPSYHLQDESLPLSLALNALFGLPWPDAPDKILFQTNDLACHTSDAPPRSPACGRLPHLHRLRNSLSTYLTPNDWSESYWGAPSSGKNSLAHWCEISYSFTIEKAFVWVSFLKWKLSGLGVVLSTVSTYLNPFLVYHLATFLSPEPNYQLLQVSSHTFSSEMST